MRTNIRERKLLAYPVKIATTYLLLTILLFLIGPIRWNIPSYPKVTIVLLVYVLAFALGYYVQMKQRFLRIAPERLQLLSDPDRPTFGFLGGVPTRYVTLIFSVSCIFSIVRCTILLYAYYGGVDFSMLLNPNLSVAYFDRLGSEMVGTWYILLLDLLNVLDVFWYILGILYFKQFGKLYKCLFLVTLLFNALYTVATGTMIAWAVFVFKLTPFLLLAWYRARYCRERKRRRNNRCLILCIIIVCLLFVVFFSVAQDERYREMGYDGITYEVGELQPFIEGVDEWPILHSIVYPVNFYITHGYCGFAHALELSPEFTYGIGYARDLAVLINEHFSFDVSDSTYPQRLEDECGWLNGRFWPSAYTWFASDLTFWGIPILMFIFGWFLCSVWYSALYENSIIAVTLFSWLWTGVIFIPANNQLFQSFGTFMATVSLIVLYVFRRHLPLFVIRRDETWRQGREQGRHWPHRGRRSTRR